MTEKDQKIMLKAMTQVDDDAVLSTYLTLAGQRIVLTAYPFSSEGKTVPDQYKMLQIEIAAYLINKRGAEGETAHSDGVTSRSYEDADIPASMLKNITPFCGVIS